MDPISSPGLLFRKEVVFPLRVWPKDFARVQQGRGHGPIWALLQHSGYPLCEANSHRVLTGRCIVPTLNLAHISCAPPESVRALTQPTTTTTTTTRDFTVTYTTNGTVVTTTTQSAIVLTISTTVVTTVPTTTTTTGTAYRNNVSVHDRSPDHHSNADAGANLCKHEHGDNVSPIFHYEQFKRGKDSFNIFVHRERTETSYSYINTITSYATTETTTATLYQTAPCHQLCHTNIDPDTKCHEHLYGSGGCSNNDHTDAKVYNYNDKSLTNNLDRDSYFDIFHHLHQIPHLDNNFY
ncbi:hypothetical protein ACEQ8H_007485 [Pleosporales sp. CAS-2024a]